MSSFRFRLQITRDPIVVAMGSSYKEFERFFLGTPSRQGNRTRTADASACSTMRPSIADELKLPPVSAAKSGGDKKLCPAVAKCCFGVVNRRRQAVVMARRVYVPIAPGCGAKRSYPGVIMSPFFVRSPKGIYSFSFAMKPLQGRYSQLSGPWVGLAARRPTQG
jgi:hypothetical protein